ncbi:MAG: hypothetical protein KAT00_05480 [Planctomycetes bacterium]|nr:hypothetical protein [Planctomycetota bacterium]
MAALAITEDKPNWASQQLWREKLCPRMTDSTVFNLLGEPVDKETTPSAMIWYYHECPKRVDGKVTYRPVRGIVRFRLVKVDAGGQRLNNPYFAVVDWREPDWPKVEAQLQAAKFLAEAETAKKLAEVEKARIEAEQELERQRIERKKLEQEQLLAEQKRLAEEQARIEAERQRLEAEEARKWLGFPKEYWYFGGGGFLIAVVLISIFKRAGTGPPY